MSRNKIHPLRIAINTPWKFFFEVKRLLLQPLIRLYLKVTGVKIGKNPHLYGAPVIFRHRNSTIKIGDNFENRNWRFSNPLGVDHPTILTTWNNNAKIIIGHNVGITGGAICAAKSIKIGNNCLIGANCTIVDTDFHPIRAKKRRYKQNNSAKEVVIEENVFVGMNTNILKGVRIGKNSVIGAGSIIRKDVPANSIYSNKKITILKP